MKKLIALGLLSLFALTSHSADYYYVGSSGSPADWNNASYWSASSGGAGGAGIPGTGDVAIFDTNSPSCTLDTDIQLYQLLLQSSYSGVLDLDPHNLTTEYSSGNGRVQIDSGEIQLGSGTHTIKGHWFYNGGTITPDTATYITYAPNTTYTTNSGSYTLYNYTISNSQSGSSWKGTYLLGTITVTGRFYPIGYSVGGWPHYVSGGGEVRARGSLLGDSGGKYIRGNIKLTIDGEGDQVQDRLIWTPTGGYEVNKPSGTLIYTNNQSFGAFDGIGVWTAAFNSPVDFTNNQTTLSIWHRAKSSKSSTKTLTNSVPPVFYNLSLRGDSGTGIGNIDLNSQTWTVRNDCTIKLDSSGGWDRRIQNGTLDIKGDLTLTIPYASSRTKGTATIQLSGDQSSSLYGAGTSKTFNSMTLDKQDAAAVTLTSALGLQGTGQDLVITSGILDLGGYDLSVADILQIDDSLQLTGAETITVGSFNLDTNSSTIIYSGTNTAVVTDLPASTLCNLTLGAGKTHTFAPGITNQVTILGALDANGLPGSRSLLRSTADGSDWYLNLQGQSQLENKTDVKDSNAGTGLAVEALGSTDNGNNTNWIFTGGPVLYAR